MAGEKTRIGVFVCDCGLNIAGTIDTQAVSDYAEKLPDVVAVQAKMKLRELLKSMILIVSW